MGVNAVPVDKTLSWYLEKVEEKTHFFLGVMINNNIDISAVGVDSIFDNIKLTKR
jgi:hypothetical protein